MISFMLNSLQMWTYAEEGEFSRYFRDYIIVTGNIGGNVWIRGSYGWNEVRASTKYSLKVFGQIILSQMKNTAFRQLRNATDLENLPPFLRICAT